MVKKLTAICITFLMSLAVIAGAAYASGNPTINVADVVSEAGGQVDVAISLENNPGIVSMRLLVSYDEGALTLINVTDKRVFGSSVHGNNLEANPYVLSWANDTALENFVVNDTIAVLTFEINKNAKSKKYPISITYDNADYDIFNVGLKTVDFDVSGGSITVKRKEVIEEEDVYEIETSELSVGNTVSFTANMKAPTEYDGDLIVVATYEDETVLEAVYIYPAAIQVPVSFVAPEKASFIKLYWWNMDIMKPYAKPVRIELD